MSKEYKRGKLKRIHVNQHVLKDNLKNDKSNAAITVKSGKENLYGSKVNIYDDQGKIVATVVQPKDRKLSCGAKVWIETRNRVEVINEEDEEDEEDEEERDGERGEGRRRGKGEDGERGSGGREEDGERGSGGKKTEGGSVG